jgi:flagellar motor component MotA
MTKEQFEQEAYATITQLLHASEVSRREGLLALEETIHDQKKWEDRDLYTVGMTFVIDGTDGNIIEKWFETVIHSSYRDDDYFELIIANIIKTGVLGIQEGSNPRVLLQMMDALIPQQYRTDLFKKIYNQL